ncbi:TAXI family TRAP transporter solute-binding subunit [Variovorax sp. J22P271]|uniref:TAXI family TRAP transporter solute-binding subunit n=1 Tax=Variovorax davisae TaxID=3053515 RepID=UPI00257701CF|nr:TAXI family TRAP transporter solute-binding subunit [Variovorax sp. J22P271]MDM0031987.1 TAXI family TRAP transporter solute-binding subunit [Variovorax sp. J22P271]
MQLGDLPGGARRERVRWTLLVVASIALALIGAWSLRSAIPRHIVLASGLRDGMYHQYAQRYKEILARDGVTVEERMTGGAEENERLLRDPHSGVDVAFVHGGVVRPADREKLVMLATLYYEPLWIFYRDNVVHEHFDELRHRRLAVGSADSGVRAFMEPLLAVNNITSLNSDLVPLVNLEALRALQAGQVDAAFLLGPAEFPAIWQALHDPELKLMSLARSEAYPRRFPYITKLTLPPGTIDLAQHIPGQEVKLIGTKAMLVSRDDLSTPIVNLLLGAARELHGSQGYFEALDEFPNTAMVDLSVSADADRHHRFGPSLLHRYLPFGVAAYLERLIVLLVPVLFVIVPLSKLLPQLLRWRTRSRIYRWYGELALLEREVGTRTGVLPVEQWLGDLNRIEQAAARIRAPLSYASEAYTLREHIGLVRRAVMAKAQDGAANANGDPENAAG